MIERTNQTSFGTTRFRKSTRTLCPSAYPVFTDPLRG